MSVIDLKKNKCTSDTSNKIALLDELLPNIKKYAGETFVICYNGQALYDKQLAMKFAHDIVLMKQLGINIIIVHGGEQIVDDVHKKLNFVSTYVDDTRVTDSDSIEIVEMVLSGLVNKRIVTYINDAGGSAIGLSGKDTNLIEAKKHRRSKAKPNSNIESIIDLGFVGEPTIISPDILLAFEDTDFIPVISPIARGENGETFHINTLTAAAVISSSLMVRKFIIIDDYADTIATLGIANSTLDYKALYNIAKKLLREGDNAANLLNTCVSVLQNKTESINVIDGKIGHSLLLDIFTNEKCGVLFRNSVNY
jgi:acetylglutamate kinase